MMNMSIQCDVTECKYNNKTEKYCTLNAIKVEREKNNDVTSSSCTDCASFERE